jgi:hypothetical protein
MMRMKQGDFRRIDAYKSLSEGDFRISYTDNTHLRDDEWIELLDVHIMANHLGALSGDGEKYYTLKCAIPSNEISDDHRRVLLDALSLSVSRSGLVNPSLGKSTYVEIEELSARDGIILVPDTNALFNGTLHWLLRVFHQTHVWVLPFVVSITQLQQRETRLKSFVNKRNRNNLPQALRSRNFVNGTLSLLERYRDQYQVLELDPSLLRYMRPAGRGTVDPDEGDVLEDRLLIEGIHAVFKTTRTRAVQRVITSDLLLARVLRAEGISTLFIPTPKLGEDYIPCLHYNPIAKGFCGAPLSTLLWDLTHTFSAIRLTQENHTRLQLEAYWADKTAGDWQTEMLALDFPEPAAVIAPPDQRCDEQHPAPRARIAESSSQQQTHRTAPKSSPGTLSDATIPQASLPQIFRLAGAVSIQPGTLNDVRERVPPRERPIPANARRGLEILRRAEIISFDGANIAGTPKLEGLDRALRAGDLDAISSMFMPYEPYALTLRALRDRVQLARDEVEALLRASLSGGVAKEASERLLHYTVLLGQGWIDGRLVLDGSHRTAPDEALRGCIYPSSERPETA